MKKVILSSLFFLPIAVSAASVSITLDTRGTAINVIEATIALPTALKSVDVNAGDSAVLIWISEPSFDPIKHTLSFSGLIPGGFMGVHHVLTLSGNFRSDELWRFSVSHLTALQNDGLGTPAQVKLLFAASATSSDAISPEPFTPVIGRSPDVFDNNYFLSFLTQDKQGGVDHYDYASTRLLSPNEGDWHKIESPFLIPNNDLSKRLFVRAVDKEGNLSISSVSGPHRALWLSAWGIIIVFIACVLYYRRFLF